MKLYGHSKPDSSEERWQLLSEHLENVAARARAYASSFRAGDLAEAAGLLHDQGKASLEYQERLRGAAYRVDHSTAGAQWADKNLGPMGRLIAACVAGHHAGLLDGKSSDDSCLAHRLIKKDLPKLIAVPASPDPGKAQGKLPIQQDGPRIAFQLAFFTRMLFSCLVDADFLDTERFMDPQKASWRNGFPNLAELRRRFLPKLDAKLAAAVPTAINLKRKEILETCFDRAEDTPGLFSLTVPTGGGKTLSSLAFALKHALRHDFTRVIYDIPYTSIIEQNAEVFREFLGEDAVLEHRTAPSFQHDSKKKMGRNTTKTCGALSWLRKTGTPL